VLFISHLKNFRIKTKKMSYKNPGIWQIANELAGAIFFS